MELHDHAASASAAPLLAAVIVRQTLKAPVEEWKALAGGDVQLENALVRLHVLFRDADTLGSLVDPKRATEIADPTGLQRSLDDTEWSATAPILEKAVELEPSVPATNVVGADAVAIARSADFLSRPYTLVATNVPYLTAQKQRPLFVRHLEAYFGVASMDLFAAMLLRANALADTVAAVTPQKWWFLASFEDFRRYVISVSPPVLTANLGSRSFSTPMWDFPIGMTISRRAAASSAVCFVSAASGKGPEDKQELLRTAVLAHRGLRDVVSSPSAVLSSAAADRGVALSTMCDLYEGSKPGQTQRATRVFWESPRIEAPWVPLASSPDSAGRSLYSGLTKLILADDELRRAIPESNTSGQGAHARRGVLIAKIGDLPSSLYGGWRFDNNTFAIVPRDSDLAGALWHFVRSGEFLAAARNINQKLDIALGAVGSVPFDVERWRAVAQAAEPLPEPWSDDPTQWLFDGRPEMSMAPLQVAVGRLVGYRWPEQAESDGLNVFADVDGIVGLPSVAGEAPAAERLQQMLAAAYGDAWSPARVKELLEQAGSKKKNLADWLRDEFFKQHCAMFGNRPFVWHIWDGQRDGFSALVNYHRLDRKMLEKLTYTYLGQDWVERQRAEVRDEVAGAEARLSAALELQRRLEAIIHGEKPYDIYVRWKELHEQPVGWEPDLNDGVRLNIRPFVKAEVLRAPFNIHWKKDRGKNPDGSERLNETELSLTDKTEARKRVGRS